MKELICGQSLDRSVLLIPFQHFLQRPSSNNWEVIEKNVTAALRMFLLESVMVGRSPHFKEEEKCVCRVSRLFVFRALPQPSPFLSSPPPQQVELHACRAAHIWFCWSALIYKKVCPIMHVHIPVQHEFIPTGLSVLICAQIKFTVAKLSKWII